MIRNDLLAFVTIVLLGVVGIPMSSRALEQDDRARQNERQNERQEEQRNAQQRNRAEGQQERAQNRDQQEDDQGVTAEREAAALTFVRRHHAELQELLLYLKENRPREYDQAIKGLFRKSEQLAAIRDRGDREGYRLQLNLWKTDSRARLLAARISMTDTEELRNQLQAALVRHNEIQIEIAIRERDRLNERAERLSDHIEQLETNSDQLIERQIRALLRATGEPQRNRANQSADDNRRTNDRSDDDNNN